MFSSVSFLVTWLVISSLFFLAVSMVNLLFSLLFVFSNDLKSSVIVFTFYILLWTQGQLLYYFHLGDFLSLFLSNSLELTPYFPRPTRLIV